jgi:glutathione synthase/RimK-type ligase-like ATP-grasp enzyme
MEAAARESHVLIVSTKLDMATDAVVRRLQARGARISRLNTEDFPFDSHVTTEFLPAQDRVSVRISPLGVDTVWLDDISSVWYRRVRIPERPPEMLPGVYDFCVREARSALLGALLLKPTRIMSPPARVWEAEHKIFQLAAAQAAGLLIPETVITNDPHEVRKAFTRFNGQMIAKPVRTGFVDLGEEQLAIFTSQVLESHLEEIDDARWSPAIYQPLIEKQCDVRVTVVGSEIFAAEIDSQTDEAAKIDWRHTSNPSLPHRRADLPSILRDRIRCFCGGLGIAFGAVDLIRTPHDRYVFLEVNPSGQWLWLDDTLKLGISDAIANWLSG